MTRIFTWMIALVALAYAGLFLALQIPMVAVPEPLDAQPPKSQLADPEKALTLARATGRMSFW